MEKENYVKEIEEKEGISYDELRESLRSQFNYFTFNDVDNFENFVINTVYQV